MLSPEEFTVGPFGSAKPGSLILPRTKYEVAALIGETANGPFAVALSGQMRFVGFSSAGNDNWRGIVVPNVQIQMDPSSAVDATYGFGEAGMIVRAKTDLTIKAKSNPSYGPMIDVVLQSGLEDAQDAAGFTRWRVVLGTGERQRVLYEMDLGES